MWIRWFDQFKLYEDQNGCFSYLERAIRKVVNGIERAYYERLDVNALKESRPLCQESVVLSLTTFPARIQYVHLAIKSLLNQTVKPDKVILWLAEDQFHEVEIPGQLKELCEYGLEIRYCKENIMAHKKYFYAMQEFPNDIIVTYDDDIIYTEDSLEKLLRMHKQFPKAIICNRGREIEIENGEVAPYKHWKVSGRVPKGVPSYRVMASTGAGTLYPPRCMPEETFNIDKIRQLALTADDLWMKVMSIKGDVPVVKSQTRTKALCISKNKQKITLAHKNVDQNLNDQVMRELLEHYPEARKILLEED